MALGRQKGGKGPRLVRWRRQKVHTQEAGSPRSRRNVKRMAAELSGVEN